MLVMPGRIASARLIAREQELEDLAAALELASETAVPRVVLVAGEAGVGKSRLIAEFADTVRASGGMVLLGHCVEVSQGDLPFAPIIEAFRDALHELPDDRRERVLGPAGVELGRLLPELSTGLPRTDGAEGGAFSQGRFFELISGVLDRLNDGAPTVFVIEDLHWADSSTRDLLGFLARSVSGTNLLIVAAYRSDEMHRRHPLRPFLAEMTRLSQVETIDLPRLSRESVVEQAAAILGSSPNTALLDRIFDLSEGNPFFVEELIAAGTMGNGEGLPHSVRDALMLRLETVREETQEVLRIAAVAGREVNHELLEEVVDIDGRSLQYALREAVERNILVADREAYSFRHALLRETVYEDLLPGERTGLHRAFADVLARAPELARRGATAAAELAYHYHEARDLSAALKASLEAARAAERAYGFAEAQRHYERVLDLWHNVPEAAELAGVDAIELLRAAADVCYLGGDMERAIALVRRALDQLDVSADPIRAGLTYERLGRYLWVLGRTEDAHEAHRVAVEVLPGDPPSAERARVLAGQAQILMLDARFSEATPYAEAAIEMARKVGAREVLGHALNTLGVAVATTGDPDRGIDHLLEARAIAEEMDNHDDLARTYSNLAEMYTIARRFDEAIADYRAGIELGERLGLSGTYGVWHHVDLAHILLPLGRWDEAEEVLGEIDQLPYDQVAGAMFVARARLSMWRGDLDAAATALHEARERLQFVSPPQSVGPLRATEAELALWRGVPIDARAAAARGLEQLARSEEHAHGIALCWFGLWAEADIATRARATRDEDAVKEAVALGEALLMKAQELQGPEGPLGPPTGPWADGVVPTLEAERIRLAGDADPKVWRRAAENWDALGDPFRAAYCRWRAAEAALVTGARAEAAGDLREAQEAASGLRARVLLNEIEALATRGRIGLERDEAEEPAHIQDPAAGTGLTARELEVLKLVAEGMTNPQIAETLFISQKTVSVHVSHILEKFGVSSRVEAAGVAHRLGI